MGFQRPGRAWPGHLRRAGQARFCVVASPVGTCPVRSEAVAQGADLAALTAPVVDGRAKPGQDDDACMGAPTSS
jgi:hypothetical protein